MSGYRNEYWTDAIEAALSDIGKDGLLSREELETVGGSLAGSAENQSIAFGWDVASANLDAAREREKDDLRKEVRREREKIICRECNGRGRIITQGPYHSSNSQCWKCRGAGRHAP